MYKVTSGLEILTGIDFQYRKWQDIEEYYDTIETSEKSTKMYVGVNYHF